jgi:hypothetical protein
VRSSLQSFKYGAVGCGGFRIAVRGVGCFFVLAGLDGHFRLVWIVVYADDGLYGTSSFSKLTGPEEKMPKESTSFLKKRKQKTFFMLGYGHWGLQCP